MIHFLLEPTTKQPRNFSPQIIKQKHLPRVIPLYSAVFLESNQPVSHPGLLGPVSFAFLGQRKVVPGRVERPDAVLLGLGEELPALVDRVLLDGAGDAEEQSGHEAGHHVALPGAVHAAGRERTDHVVEAGRDG